MKNAIDEQGMWARELATFDAALRARGMAEKTRRAYGVDLQQLADWAARQGLDSRSIDQRVLRRFAGALSERGPSRSPIPPQLPPLSCLFPPPGGRGQPQAHPAGPRASPPRAPYPPP